MLGADFVYGLPELLYSGFPGIGVGCFDALLDQVDDIVSIPLANNVESLNVGSAVAILCYHKARS